MRARIARGGMDLWAVLAAAAVATLLLIAATQMQAQTHAGIHDLTGASDGATPYSGPPSIAPETSMAPRRLAEFKAMILSD